MQEHQEDKYFCKFTVVMEPIQGGVTNELQCPYCIEMMVPPFIMCANGHIVCKQCRPNLQNCPTCPGQISSVRNVSLEFVARSFDYPCAYSTSGCTQTFLLHELDRHQSQCFYSPAVCIFANTHTMMCKWEGTRMELKCHVTNAHKAIAHSYNKKYNVRIMDFSIAQIYFEIIFAFDEIFYRRAEVKEGNWHCTTFYVGRKELAPKFKYKLTFTGEDGTYIIVSKLAQYIGDDTLDIYVKCTCVKLPLDVVMSFLDEENNLSFEMEMHKSLEPSPSQ